MKKLRLISLLVAVILAAATILCSCGGTDDGAHMGYKKVSHDGVPYNLYVPDSWTADISTGVTTAYYEPDSASISVMISSIASGTVAQSMKDHLIAYWGDCEPSLKEIFTDFEYVRELDTVTQGLGGVDAMECCYKGTIAGKEYTIRQVLAIKDAQIFIFTYTARSEVFESHAAEISDVIKFFEFT